MKKKKYTLLLMVIPFVFMVVAFEILPAISILNSSIQNPQGKYSLENYIQILTKPFYLQGIKNSLIISFQSSIVGIIISMISVNYICKLSTKGRDTVIMLSNMTSNFAGVPLAFAFMILIGNNGLFTLLFKEMGLSVFKNFNLYSGIGLSIIYIYFQVPLGILLMYPSFDSVKIEWIEAAENLGATKLQFWKLIGVPVLLPSILATLSILFANSMGAYATAYALVGGNYNLMTVRIGALISGDLFLNPNLASAIAVILGLLLLGLNIASEKLMKEKKN